MKSLPHWFSNNPNIETEAKSGRNSAAGPHLFIPGLAPHLRAIPNPLARSSIFAPMARGNRSLPYDGEELECRSDAKITFWGNRLNQSHADVWMQLLYEQSRSCPTQPIIIDRAAFLRSIGRHTGNYEYKWLIRTMVALTYGRMEIMLFRKTNEIKMSIGIKQPLYMVDHFDLDASSGKYQARLDGRWKYMFDNREYSLIDWNKRMEFAPHQEMAKALKLLIATSNDNPQRFSVERLKAKLGYTGRARDFLCALRKAMDELERVEIIAAGRIGLSSRSIPQAVWNRL